MFSIKNNIVILILMKLGILIKRNSDKCMAVPKSRRSKAKGRTRLSNWKKKAKTVAKKAINTAKRILKKEKKSEKPLKKDDVIIDVENDKDAE